MTPFWDGYPRANSAEPDQRVFTVCNLVCIFMEHSIAQWLKPRSSDPAVVGSSPGWDGYMCLPY